MTPRPSAVRRFLALAAAALVTTLFATGGCTKSAPPTPKDYTQGEFYTPDEVARLSPSERDAYCNFMESTLHDLKSDAVTLRARLDSLDAVAESLRAQSVGLSSRTRSLTTELRTLRLKEKALTSYVVRPGDDLKSIAARVYGDPGKWRRIYEANKGKIGAEDAALKVGMRLTVPREGE